jgi:hypothetical protein
VSALTSSTLTAAPTAVSGISAIAGGTTHKLEAAMRLAFLFDHIQELDICEIQVELADIITLLTGSVKKI